MKRSLLITVAAIASLTLNGCTDNTTLTKSERCDQIQRQISAYQRPNSGYSSELSQYKAQQLQQQAQRIGC